jgi:glycopeptide antibiotics resistance protein
VRFWQVWILLIVVVSGPWFGLTRTPQWDRVTWVPFTGAEDKPRDAIANLILFVPLGWTLYSRRPDARGAALAVAAGCATSVAVESMQLFCVLRDPSATDVLMNTCGTAAGVAGSLAWRRRPLP